MKNINNPDISVIIPTYNHEKFIGRALRSILDQSINKNRYEVIVVNDCSNDNSKEIISKVVALVEKKEKDIKNKI